MRFMLFFYSFASGFFLSGSSITVFHTLLFYSVCVLHVRPSNFLCVRRKVRPVGYEVIRNILPAMHMTLLFLPRSYVLIFCSAVGYVLRETSVWITATKFRRWFTGLGFSRMTASGKTSILDDPWPYGIQKLVLKCSNVHLCCLLLHTPIIVSTVKWIHITTSLR